MMQWTAAGAAICAAGYLFLTAQPPGILRSLAKTAAVALLALGGGLAGAPLLLVLALGLCALGDLFLSRDGESAFMAGVGAFAAGHLAYAALFLGPKYPMRCRNPQTPASGP